MASWVRRSLLLTLLIAVLTPPPDGRLLTVTSLLSASLQTIYQRLHHERRAPL